MAKTVSARIDGSVLADFDPCGQRTCSECVFY